MSGLISSSSNLIILWWAKNVKSLIKIFKLRIKQFSVEITKSDSTATIWRKFVTSFFWLTVAALTLTAWLPSSIYFFECSNQLCFLMHPLIPHALTLQSLIACPLLWHTWHKRCFLTAAYRSFTLMFLNSRHIQFLLVSSASGLWSLCICFVFFTFNLALKFDVFQKCLYLFVPLRSSSLRSRLKTENPSCTNAILESHFSNIITSGQSPSLSST